MAPALSSVRSLLLLVFRLADMPELALPDTQLALSVQEIKARWSQSRCRFLGTRVGIFTSYPSLAYLIQEVFAYSLREARLLSLHYGFPRVISRTLLLHGLARPVSRLLSLSRFPKESYQPVWLLARR